MDPIAHTLTGAALGRAGLHRTTPLATATLMLAANAPDVDVLVYAFTDQYGGLAFRRGWTHGVLALVVWPFVLAGAILAWDRLVRRRRRPAASPARLKPLLLVAALGVLTHPALDWLNNYGMRWLMPFDGRWSYGDALFIIDPWVWITLGGALFLAHSTRVASVVAWTLLALTLSLAVLGSAMVPLTAKVLWLAALGGLVAARVAGAGCTGRTERFAAAAVVLTAAYAVGMVVADRAARAHVQATLAARGVTEIEAIMVAPVPANPFAGFVVAATPDMYHHGSFHWFARPRLTLEPQPIPRTAPPVIVAAAARERRARDFLTWSRFPFFVVQEEPDVHRVRIGDARYERMPSASSLRGLVVDVAR